MKHINSKEQIDKILETLVVKISDTVEGSYADVLYLKNDELFISFIEPHEGTNWKFCLRADFPETFDRWSVCLFEREYQNEEFASVLSELIKFSKDKAKIVEEELNN